MKNKKLVVILALLLGGTGAHKFYLGETGKGIVYLLFSWTIVPVVLGVFDGLILLTMSKQNFDKKYNHVDYINDRNQITREELIEIEVSNPPPDSYNGYLKKMIDMYREMQSDNCKRLEDYENKKQFKKCQIEANKINKQISCPEYDYYKLFKILLPESF